MPSAELAIVAAFGLVLVGGSIWLRRWFEKGDNVRHPPRISTVEVADPVGDRLEKIGIGVFLVVTLWGALWPHPYLAFTFTTSVASLAGSLLLIVFRRSLAPFGHQALDGRASGWGWSCASLLGLRAYADAPLTSSGGPVIFLWCLGAGLVLSLLWLALSRSPFKAPRWTIATCALAFLIGTACVHSLNVALSLDDGRPGTTAVVDKRVIEGRRGRESYALTLAPMPGDTRRGDLSVERSVYQRVQPAQRLCFTLHSGGLGAAWYRIGRCPAGFPMAEPSR